MDKFDKHVKEEVQGYLNKHVHFSQEESQKIRSKTINKSSTIKFHGVYYIVLASTIVLITILSIPLFDTLNFNSNSQSDYSAVEEKETEDNEHIKASLDNIVNGNAIKRSQKMFSNEVTNNLQLSIINNPEKYKLSKASFNYWSKSGEHKDPYSSEQITLALSFQSQQNSYFTQIFKGEINLEGNHKVVEKVGEWNLIPDSKTHSNMEENKYIIAVSEIIIDHEKYTVIVQTYNLHDDIDAAPYSKTDILDFTESLKPELAVKNLLEIIPDEFQTETVLDFQGVSYLTTKEYLHTPSGLPIYKTEVFYTDFDELQQQPDFFEFTKDVEGHLYKGTLKLYRAEKEGDSWKAMYSGVISRVESSNE
ncbi:hypothetical protein [Solibacillus daqui]|uniref:hypothetical protein n=1 Tax=Solibacillus daqui TaxID=2912187 RepID=UPI002366FE16|nr:hypothetical protein [Solibacillus daqui]